MENTSATNPNKKKFVESLASKSYTGPSIVDYLSKSGYDSSLSSRNQLASEYGVKDYVPGSAQSNTALMAALRGGNNNVTNPSESEEHPVLPSHFVSNKPPNFFDTDVLLIATFFQFLFLDSCD